MKTGWQFPRKTSQVETCGYPKTKPAEAGYRPNLLQQVWFWLSIEVIQFLLLLSACQTQSTPLAPGPVTFTPAVQRVPTTGGLTLAGTLYGKGELAVILAHGAGGDQSDWQSFAEELAQHGVSVLTFNFRGYYPSTGEIDGDAILPDVQAALAFLHQHGYQRAICIGASMGGTACALAASQPGMMGLISLSGPHQVLGQPVTLASFSNAAYPKLFVAGENEGSGADAARLLYAMAPEPKELWLVPNTGAHALALFKSDYRDELRSRLFEFVENLK
jgi:pimeloyl-ACP methyl ester carboxylesterase